MARNAIRLDAPAEALWEVLPLVVLDETATGGLLGACAA
jgi:hypothetical protein